MISNGLMEGWECEGVVITAGVYLFIFTRAHIHLCLSVFGFVCVCGWRIRGVIDWLEGVCTTAFKAPGCRYKVTQVVCGKEGSR